MRSKSSSGALTPTSAVTSSSNVVGETPQGSRGHAPPPLTTNTSAATTTTTSGSAGAKKQRSIHDFFGGSRESSGSLSTKRKKRSLVTTPSLDDEPIKKRIDYDDASLDDESEDMLMSQTSEPSAASSSFSIKPKRIDFGGICPSSQRSEPDIEPPNYEVVSAEPFARQASQGMYYGGYSGYGGGGGGMFSQDDLDFCTPADQPVMHLSHPTTPSPMKKRQRRSHVVGVDLGSEEQVLNLTQDLTHVNVGRQPGEPATTPLLASISSTDSNDMLLSTPQRVLGLPAAVLPGTRRRPEPHQGAAPQPSLSEPSEPPVATTAVAHEAFTNPFAPLPAADSRKRRPPRKLRQSYPPSFTNISVPYSRYLSEFVEQELLGSGAFSKVFRCVKKIDGWTYAIKKSKRHLRGRADTERALREVHALAALSDSRHIVRYFDAWIEDDLLYIQLEQCSACELARLVDQYAPLPVPEDVLCKLLSHLAQALEAMHAKQMVHMDVKLPNVLVSACGRYKLGDLGTVAHADGSMEITEGDSRYLSRELMEGSRSNLKAGDIFALGATIYELALGTTLPNGGEEWQKIRDGDLMLFRQYSNSLQHLIASMMHPDPLQRPSADEILQHEVVLPYVER